MSQTNLCDICKEIIVLLAKFGNNCSNQDNDVPILNKVDLDIIINYINIWNTKHCVCCYKDVKSFTRFNNLVQSIVVTSFNLLKSLLFKSDYEVSQFFNDWNVEDKEKLLHLKSKVYQLSFPLYMAYKHSNITKNDELTQKEIKILSIYCDLSEYEMPIFLMRKIIYFIEQEGFSLYTNCFKEANPTELPIPFAHSMISIIQSIKHYFNLSTINNELVQLRTNVINFLCKMQDCDLRMMNNRAMFEYIWSVVKEYNSYSHFAFDRDGLKIAFKYFTSSTLTMRLSGLAQINNYISIYSEIHHATLNKNLEHMGEELSQWIIDNNIIENIFGPDSHVEVIKQSQFILSFIASKITTEHVDVIWNSAQLKHYERYVFEILNQLIKNLKMKPVLYLYNHLWRIKPKDHSEHTLNLASQIIKYIWSHNGIQPDMIPSCYLPNDKNFDENSLNKNAIFSFFRDPVSKTSSSSASSIEVSDDEDEDEEEFDVELNNQQMCIDKNQISKISIEESSNNTSASDIDIELTDIEKSKEDCLNESLDEESKQIDFSDEIKDEEIDYHNKSENYSPSDQEFSEKLNDKDESIADVDYNLLDDGDRSKCSDIRGGRKIEKKNFKVQNDNQIDFEFQINDVCKVGNTLLWDILQDDMLNNLNEEVKGAAEKILWNTICCASNRDIRFKFINGCLDNLSRNYSVIVSIRLLQNLFSSFFHYNDGKLTRRILVDAEKEKNMLKSFFNTLDLFMTSQRNSLPIDQAKFASLKEDIQIRLNFLSFIFIYSGSHESLSFSHEHINILWNIFTTFDNSEIVDEFFDWFLNQVKIHSGLNLDLIKHILFEKMPQLSPESFSLISLELLQHLHGFILSKNCENLKTFNIVIKLLWDIAFKNPNNEVSMNASRHLNHYYINLLNCTNQFDKEEEFIQLCISYLKDASIILPINCDKSLVLIERAVVLLKTHLETFYGRYSYFFRKLRITSDVDLYMHKIRDKSEGLIRIFVNSPYNDKTSFEFLLTDFIGDLRAEVQFWWQSFLSKNNINDSSNSLDSLICLVLLEHEIPFEYDDKRLIDLGFKESQSSHITFNSYKHTLSKTLDILPLSLSNEFFDIFKEKNPKNLLLQSQNFELLFTLMQQLDSIGNLKARILSRNIWEIVQMLPTSNEIYSNFKQLLSLSTENNETDLTDLFHKLFPFKTNQKLIYSCQIVEYLKKNNKQWPQTFIECGGLCFVYNLLIEEVESIDKDWTEWKQDCLSSLTQLVFQFAIYNFSKNDGDKTCDQSCLPYLTSSEGARKNKRLRKNSIEKNLIFQFNDSFLPTIVDNEKLMNSLLSLLNYVSLNSKLVYQTSIWSRAQVVSYTLTLFTSWCYSDFAVFDLFFKHKDAKVIVKKLTLDDPDPMVRKESCSAFTRLCLGSNTEGKNINIFTPKVLSLLLSFIEEASLVNVKKITKIESSNEEKFSHGPGSKDYFALVCRLIEPFATQFNNDTCDIDLDFLCESVANSILKRKNYESRKNSVEDEGLRGMLVLLTVLTKHNSAFKNNSNCKVFIVEIFNSLFALPTQAQTDLPKCKAVNTRTAAFDFLLELVKGNESNYLTLTNLLIDQHRHEIIGRSSAYPWEYWPTDDKRSECGFVGLTNLGATCYMASCMQHLFMLLEARNAIVTTNLSSVIKHEPILRELQKMFIFLQESERKAYNPKNFCKVYTMDHQPLNICEQKDMTEFFTDLITKLEEMTVELKDMVKKHFSGLQSNNVVSLDCSHISQTTEEFYTLRCQVADMKDLYESLNEVTVKDTLEGANMYNCSKCGKMVRAEKRACIKKLPKILCFNTMRYTFNMATMTKEKVNTHFSFPFSIDMAPYLERNLLNISDVHDAELLNQSDDEETSTKYDLIGVTVHTGTADGGHYYSFIQDRDPQSLTKNKWFLFNDAEVKFFDKSQIPTECFGGEMTSKSYDQANDKFLNFSFEKTNSAYMLFYERHEISDGQCVNQDDKVVANEKSQNDAISKELLDWIWNDNISFLRDRFIFEHAYFDFIWHVCTQIPVSLPVSCSNKSTLISTRLATLFVLETLIHAKEKPTIASWIELLTKQFNNSPQACEWLIDHLSLNDWWSIQILFKCSNQMVRQLFVRLCIHVIVKLKPVHSPIYIHPLHAHLNEGELNSSVGLHSCVTRFIRRLISLISEDLINTKPQIKYLTEYFSFLLEFAKQGDDECRFLMSIETISIMVHFYMNYGKISNELFDSLSDNEDEDIDERPQIFGPVIDEKYPKIASLDRMITLIVYLIEKTHESLLNLPKRDFDSLVSGKTFQFIQQQIRDNINLRQTFNLICSICRLDETLSSPIINMLFSSIIRNPENSVSFFKILYFIIDTNWIFPYFSKLILPKIWELAEHTSLHTLEWLIQPVSRNKIIHEHVLSTMDQWVIYFLVESTNLKVRSNSAQLLVSLVPSNENSFRQNYRPCRSFPYTINKEIGLTSEGYAVVDKIFTFLINQIKKVKMFADPQHHGTQKLTNYFFVMSYFLIHSKQKRQIFSLFTDFWSLFQNKLSEPAISIHQNKQSFLVFWYLSCQECPEIVKFLVQNPSIYRKIPFNYILADHDDQDVVLFNKNMLPYYYGILRLCCNQSRIFTRYLALHQNIQWAFKNITPHMNHYQLAVQELFKLMKIFIAVYPDSTEQELKEIINFKKTTIKMYLNNLDPNVHWGTLIAVLMNLMTSTEDMIFIILNNGLYILFQAFSALHIMFHQATACHITTELVDLLKIISLLLTVFEKHQDNFELNEHRSRLKDYIDVKKMLLLLNTYTPSVLRNSLFEVLSKLIRVVPNEYINTITQFLLLQHVLFTEQNNPFTIGPYFPKRGQKIFQSKSSIRPSRPIFQMCFSLKKIEPFSNDKEYERLVFEFYQPYYMFVEDLCRLAIKYDIIFSELIDLIAKVAIESLSFHTDQFVQLYLDIYNDSQYNSTQFLNFLQDSKYFKQYLSIILTTERNFLVDDKVFEFMSIFLIENSRQIITQNMVKKVLSLINAFCMDSNIIDCRSAKQFLGNMLAVKLICMSRVFDCENEIIVKFCDILQKLKSNLLQQIDYKSPDKTHPNKKIKFDSEQSTSQEVSMSDSKSSSSSTEECESSNAPVGDINKLIKVIDDIINLIKLT